jgi:SAM-dependent methyltransferase
MNIITKLKIFLTKLVVKTIGRSSRGIRLVTKLGLTSGIMLDYIYQNQPQGSHIIGKYIDKIYLSHPAWEDVRIRKDNLERFLEEAIKIQRGLRRKPIILDIASGPARYILDTLSEKGMDDVEAICQDLDEEALNLGHHNAAELGLNSVKFAIGDAFSEESLASLVPKANIVVSSGFYDWITDDELVKKSMSLIFSILPSGGCFLFTNQAKHVSFELTQAVFSDHQGKPLRMSLRAAILVNGWATDAGFNIVNTTGDEKSNYSITLAQKPGSPR